MSNEPPVGTVPVTPPAHTFPRPEALIMGRTAPRAAEALEAAGLLAVTEPVAIRQHVGLTDKSGPLETLMRGYAELLRQLGYVAGARVIPSPFGGWDVVVAARRMTPQERAQ